MYVRAFEGIGSHFLPDEAGLKGITFIKMFLVLKRKGEQKHSLVVTQPNSHMRFPLDIPSSRLAERTGSTDEKSGGQKRPC